MENTEIQRHYKHWTRTMGVEKGQGIRDEGGGGGRRDGGGKRQKVLLVNVFLPKVSTAVESLLPSGPLSAVEVLKVGGGKSKALAASSKKPGLPNRSFFRGKGPDADLFALLGL